MLNNMRVSLVDSSISAVGILPSPRDLEISCLTNYKKNSVRLPTERPIFWKSDWSTGLNEIQNVIYP